MRKIAVMGDKDSIYGFASIGLEIFPAYEAQEAVQILKQLVKDDYAIIYITEKLASEISTEIEKHYNNPSPAIILIPGVSGSTGEGMRNVSKTVEKAVGSDILS